MNNPANLPTLKQFLDHDLSVDVAETIVLRRSVYATKRGIGVSGIADLPVVLSTPWGKLRVTAQVRVQLPGIGNLPDPDGAAKAAIEAREAKAAPRSPFAADADFAESAAGDFAGGERAHVL